MTPEEQRLHTENYLLTLASRINGVDGLVVLVAEKDGRFTNHQANYDNVQWISMAGNLAAIQHDILSNKVSWESVNVDGTEPEE